ncbi:ribosome recycling factor [Buchnera aphidicola]|uniref:Ribosome-recycling factor n=1 Tax=Buchnera aphidicola subsp. Melaphis rhois TaxID=118103 RepID=A0A4D6Y2X3_BUCMH|nr:ribosome recycling factor [Buchnera aphidicola]QCI23249.1 ribosome recycling factor [Buchnera aphidicola (Melaphis rhois)]
MVKKIITFTESKMNDCIELFINHLSTLRTERASPSILNSIYVDYLGNKVKLCKLSNIVVENFNTLKINLFDVSIKKNVEKAIANSDLNINPISVGNTLKIILPNLTEERRKNYVKLARNMAEQGRISIRNIRRDSNEKIKRILKDKLISNDVERNLQSKIQNLTDKYIKKINHILDKKDKDLMKI